MKNALTTLGVSLLILACGGPATAQEIELTPEMKAWEPMLGTLSGTIETRESPTGTWVKGSAEWQIRSGGYYLEVRWKTTIGGKESSSVEIVGYDPGKKCYFDTAIRDDGSWASSCMGWDGTTLYLNTENTMSDGEVRVGRMTWEHSLDFTTATGIGEVFEGGKWWPNLKIEAKRVK